MKRVSSTDAVYVVVPLKEGVTTQRRLTDPGGSVSMSIYWSEISPDRRRVGSQPQEPELWTTVTSAYESECAGWLQPGGKVTRVLVSLPYNLAGPHTLYRGSAGVFYSVKVL